MLICKTMEDNGDWSCDECLIWCFWCMQHSNPNDFQMMEQMSCDHLPSPENLACIYQMLQLVERTDGKWQHIISFQWICVLPAGYYWVPLDTCRFCTFIFLFHSLLNCSSQTCITYADADGALIHFLLLEGCRMVLSDGENIQKGETCSQSYCTCHRSGHALINGEESWGERGKKLCVLPPFFTCPVEQILNLWP